MNRKFNKRLGLLMVPALALSLAPDAPAGAAPAGPEQGANIYWAAQPATSQTGFSNSQNLSDRDMAILVSQAVMEMINQYRVANGVHPLNTHALYNRQAEAWSVQMSKYYAATRDLDSAFRHSDRAAYGRSGENIAAATGVKPSNDEEWAKLAVDFFNMWRNSPGHNENMLSTLWQGAGLSVYIDDSGAAWGTTMFFMEDVNHSNKSTYWPEDRVTAQAKKDPRPFYMPDGAMRKLGVNWTPPGSNGAVWDPYSTYENGRRSVDKSAGLQKKMDERFTGGTNQPKPTPSTTRPAPTPTTGIKPAPTKSDDSKATGAAGISQLEGSSTLGIIAAIAGVLAIGVIGALIAFGNFNV